MTTTTWIMPRATIPIPAPTPGSGFSFFGGSVLSDLNATPAAGLAGQLDMLIDPVTLDYVDTDNGEFAETADSRTAMMIQLELEFGASPFDPGDGTRLAEMRRAGDPVTPEIVQSESLRAAGLLASSGTISDLRVSVRDDRGDLFVDGSGRFQPRLSWRDLASGSPVDSVLVGG